MELEFNVYHQNTTHRIIVEGERKEWFWSSHDLKDLGSVIKDAGPFESQIKAYNAAFAYARQCEADAVAEIEDAKAVAEYGEQPMRENYA